MSSTKDEIKKVAPKTQLVKPILGGTMEYLYEESLMLFGPAHLNGKEYRPFYGIGCVYRIVKSEKFDVLYVRFGAFNTIRHRMVVVYENRARRQILTLKRGHYCQIYGVCKNYTEDINLHGNIVKGVKLGLYAHAINGWYVPTMLDIKKLPKNEDFVNPSEKEKDVFERIDKVLDDFMTKGDNKEWKD